MAMLTTHIGGRGVTAGAWRGLLLAAVLAWSAPVATAADAPNGKVIAEVVVQGNRIIGERTIRTEMKSRPNTVYSQTVVDEDIARLAKLNAFTKIDILFQVLQDDRVRLYVTVVEVAGVVKEIDYGAPKHLKVDELNTLTGLRVGMPMNPAANRAGANAILQRYHEMGRMFASVDLSEGKRYEDTRVVFNITEGPEVKVTGVSFTGNTFVSGERLRTQTTVSRAFLGFGGTYNPTQIKFDAQKLEDYYHEAGYLDCKVRPEIEWNDGHKSVSVMYHVSEGPRYQVRKVQIDGNRILDKEKVLSVTHLREGQTLDKGVVQADLAQIKDLYGYRGHAVAVRDAYYTTGTPGEVNVHYTIEERPPARVGQVIILGNTTTRENVIRRQVPLFPGQILTYPDLRAAERNLARLNIFEVKPEEGIRPTVTVLENDSDSETKDVLVQVQESATGSFLLGVGVNSDAGLSGSIVLNERNFDLFRPPTSVDDLLSGRAFRGAGQELRIEAVPGTQFQRYTATFREPFLFDSEYGLSLSGYYFTRAFNEYTENRTGLRAGLDRRFGSLWRANLGLRVEQVNVTGVSAFAPDDIFEDLGSHLLVGLRGGVTRDSRDSYVRPTEGSLFEASFEQVVGDFSFPLLTAEFSKFWTTFQRADGSGRQVLSFRSQLAIAGSQAPVFERFYAGGFRSLRGFEFRGVGPFQPGLFGSGPFNVGGELSFLNSLEYQIPLVANDQIFFVTFLDTGTVERNVEFKDYRVTAGFGLRMVVPMLGPVPIALDFGFPINKGPGDREQIFSFWLGFFN